MNDLPLESRPLLPVGGVFGRARGSGDAAVLAASDDANRSLRVLGVLITLGVAVADACTCSINLSVVYCLPMAVFARTARPAAIWRVASILVLLDYLFYFVGPWPGDVTAWSAMFFNHRMANRSVSAGSILAIALMSHFGIVLRRRMDSRWDPRALAGADGVDREVLADVIDAFDRFQAAAMTVVAVVLVAAVDFVSPAQFNPAIAYIVPVIACARARRRVFLWVVTAVCVGLIFAGFYGGPALTIDAGQVERVLRNRRVTAIMIAGIALFTHLLIGVDNPRERRVTPASRPTCGGNG